MKIKIKVSTGEDFDLNCDENIDLNELKNLIIERLSIDNYSSSQIRIMHQGRLLNDKSIIKPQCKIRKASSDSFVSQENSPLIEQNIILHVALSEFPTSSRENQQIQPLTGFDRLRELGYSREEISNLRSQFQQANNIDPENEDEYNIEETRRLEEEWIDNTNRSLPDGTPINSYKDFLFGISIGFFFSIIVLFWLNESTFSKRFKYGIISGMMMNILFGFMNFLFN